MLKVFLSKKDNVLLLIELKCKLLRFNKETSEKTETLQKYNLGYNNDIFQKIAFLNLEALLKDIFEKCWRQRSCVVKMNSLSIYSLHILITFSTFRICFEQYYNNIENVFEKSHFFGTFARKR